MELESSATASDGSNLWSPRRGPVALLLPVKIPTLGAQPPQIRSDPPQSVHEWRNDTRDQAVEG